MCIQWHTLFYPHKALPPCCFFFFLPILHVKKPRCRSSKIAQDHLASWGQSWDWTPVSLPPQPELATIRSFPQAPKSWLFGLNKKIILIQKKTHNDWQWNITDFSFLIIGWHIKVIKYGDKWCPAVQSKAVPCHSWGRHLLRRLHVPVPPISYKFQPVPMTHESSNRLSTQLH